MDSVRTWRFSDVLGSDLTTRGLDTVGCADVDGTNEHPQLRVRRVTGITPGSLRSGGITDRCHFSPGSVSFRDKCVHSIKILKRLPIAFL